MANGPRIRALVLTAGLGTRLRPLTDDLPKPLLPVAGRPLVESTLERLWKVGCEAVALNLHYRGEQIRRRLGDRFGDLPLVYSEEPELLGTLGALGQLRSFVGAADVVLVINGDSLCAWPLKGLVKRHLKRRPMATLLLARRADPRRFGGGVGVDTGGRLVSFRSSGPATGAAARHYVFAGAQAIDPESLSGVEAKPADIVRDLYEPAILAGEGIDGWVTGRRWHDLGTPKRYLDGLLDTLLAGRRWRNWISDRAEVDPGARLRGTVVEAGATIGPGAQVEGSLILPGARVGRDAVAQRSIVGFDTRLPEGAVVENRLVASLRPDRPADPRDSVVGGLTYRPLDE